MLAIILELNRPAYCESLTRGLFCFYRVLQTSDKMKEFKVTWAKKNKQKTIILLRTQTTLCSLFFVVQHYPALEGFYQDFQDTVHFPLSSAIHGP